MQSVRCGIPAVDMSTSLKMSKNLEKNAPQWDAISIYEFNSHLSFQRMIQIAELLFT